ncbi:MAG: aspartate aminotransferase family protein [Nostoc desertorum CM1-VF14]|jgi:glutamate-1-semialdehyde-2,1-aminomutase|nr:aspartate aminotransferase family protein [Nostoc desertorum CM1-VF14]
MQLTNSTTTAKVNPQQQYLENFIASYTNRTQTSKQLTQAYRSVLADRRNSIGFNKTIKEIVYPIIGKRASGSKIWDVDGNEYIDLLMGFGVSFFGHNPPFIKEAIQERLEQGIHIGPQSDLAGEVAELFCELTGMERVTFSNTGTEAVMTAIRLARATTGRQKIAMFAGSYHGHFDGTLVKRQKLDDNLVVVPRFPGVLPNVAQDVLVLDYGDFKSLEVIKAYQHELAAVLVEPIQDERPDIQPQEFLLQLREITQKSGTALIFDEMLTGFRIHLGGAQAWFGVKADIATYGKIVGGGLPIGVIAGKADYMDRIDGGIWSYEDTSFPQVETTFFSGTYCKHPLAMAAAKAVLNYLKNQGTALQEQVNQRTSQFVEKLNNYFQTDGVPIRLANCGSMFNNIPLEDASNSGDSTSLSMNLISYHLLYRGVFLIGNGGLLSTAHTDEDLGYVIQVVKNTIKELREGGLLP